MKKLVRAISRKSKMNAKHILFNLGGTEPPFVVLRKPPFRDQPYSLCLYFPYCRGCSSMMPLALYSRCHSSLNCCGCSSIRCHMICLASAFPLCNVVVPPPLDASWSVKLLPFLSILTWMLAPYDASWSLKACSSLLACLWLAFRMPFTCLQHAFSLLLAWLQHAFNLLLACPCLL